MQVSASLLPSIAGVLEVLIVLVFSRVVQVLGRLLHWASMMILSVLHVQVSLLLVRVVQLWLELRISEPCHRCAQQLLLVGIVVGILNLVDMWLLTKWFIEDLSVLIVRLIHLVLLDMMTHMLLLSLLMLLSLKIQARLVLMH